MEGLEPGRGGFSPLRAGNSIQPACHPPLRPPLSILVVKFFWQKDKILAYISEKAFFIAVAVLTGTPAVFLPCF
jgi:hypothetical protein